VNTCGNEWGIIIPADTALDKMNSKVILLISARQLSTTLSD
jgi:hypothetical protein